MKNSVPVLIVGAGPTGLVLAISLKRQGIDVRIIDKTAQPGTTSRAMIVHGRTLEFYHQFGFADAVVEHGGKVDEVNLWVRGKPTAKLQLKNIATGQTPYPFALVYPQDAHERFLIDRLAELGVQVERQTELVRFEQQADAVLAILKHADGAEEHCQAEYLAGCDGARSTVRETLGTRFSGGTYEGLFYVADVEVDGPVPAGALHVSIDLADIQMVFPLRENNSVRLIGNVRASVLNEDRPLDFDTVRSRTLEHLQLTVKKVNWFSTYRVHHRIADNFHYGRVFLAGDAGHIHSPVGGQGMNTGIGDAVNLAWKLAAVLRGKADAKLLDTYEEERVPFARRLVATTDRAFTIVTSPGRFARWVRTRVVPFVLPRLFQFQTVRRFFFRTVSQVGIQYRESPLSQGAAGHLRAGDRLPWVNGKHGDNFSVLSSLDWQVHIYGAPHRELQAVCSELQLALHVFEWAGNAQHAGLRKDCLYLVRPDGYLALIDQTGDPLKLRRYMQEVVQRA